MSDLQRVMTYVKSKENEFIQKATECGNKEAEKGLATGHKDLSAAKQREKELEVIFRKLYEDNALGKISDKQFVSLTSGYEDEKEQLSAKIRELETKLTAAAENKKDAEKFVQLVKRYTEISELTYENVHEFIDRILIHELDKEANTRQIEIFYNFVGKIDSNEKPCESVSYFRQIGADITSVAM